MFNDAGSTTASSGDSVHQWNEQSGSSTSNAIQSNGARQPIYTENSLNGYPTISFNGSDILPISSVATLSSSSIFIVYSGTYIASTNGDQLINLNGGGNSLVLELSSATNVRARAYTGVNTSINSTVSNGTPYIVSLNYNGGSTSEIFNLGSSSNTGTLPAVAAGAGSGSIGAHFGALSGWFSGEIAEIIRYSSIVNSAQKIIIENFLAAKYGLSLSANDLYDEDNSRNGNYDHDVAGIGRVDASTIHNDAQGTGLVRILSPNNLGDNEYLIWGHDSGEMNSTGVTDLPATIESRLARDWSVSETGDVGTVTIRVDLSSVPGSITTSDLRLLIDADGVYNSGATISSAPTALGSGIYEWTGINLSDNDHFTVGSIDSTQTPLPIELVDFHVKKIHTGQVLLNWQTASEINNNFFTIERSSDGINWEEINRIEGAGTSTMRVIYSEVDDDPLEGISYYRLKQTDFDGQFRYSQIRSVHTLELPNTHIKIYPNPATNKIIINGSSDELEEIVLYNSTGQNVTSLVELVRTNENRLVIDLSKLNSGVYSINTKTTANKVFKR